MFLIPGVYQVPQGHVALYERYGKYQGILTPGLNFINPITSAVKDLSSWNEVASKCKYFIELSQQQLETSMQPFYTKDNVNVEATATIYWRIIDPVKAAYDIDTLPESLLDICEKVLSAQIGCFDFDEISTRRAMISHNVTENLRNKVSKWGVELDSVEVGELLFDYELATTMHKRRIAEAERDAQLARVDAESQSSMKRAKTELDKKHLLIESEVELTLRQKRADIENKQIELEGENLCKVKQAQTEAAIRKLQVDSQVNNIMLVAKAEADAKRLQALADIEAFALKKEAEFKYLKNLGEQLGQEGLVKYMVTQTCVDVFKALGENGSNKLWLLPNNTQGMVNAIIGVDSKDAVPILSLPGAPQLPPLASAP